ncbi:uncharacterized protein LOC116425561 [Nomia melanderi]|uniref:uncharacterized protein LOC116425561 n=1 Tax=Nomia melanderi TaxID=2448451 RepID=UPI003FCD9A3A
MRSASLTVLLCIFECIGVVLAICTVSEHQGDSGRRVQCQNASLHSVLSQPSSNVGTMMILNSMLRQIPERAFDNYSTSLQILNIRKCGIREIHEGAFYGLARLKRLSLSDNDIAAVKEEWFRDTVYLEQLDLSYNKISTLQPIIFSKMLLLKRLDLTENRLACFDYNSLPGGIDKVYFAGNPLSFLCRGKMTLWMRDHGVSYKSGTDEKETWLDKLLWLCAIDDPAAAESELLIKQCVIMNLFNQLRTGLTTADSYPRYFSKCVDPGYFLIDCVLKEAEPHRTDTNANVISNLLLYLRHAKSG